MSEATPSTQEQLALRLIQPEFCQYANGGCAFDLPSPPTSPSVFVAYPGAPAVLSSTIERAVDRARASVPGVGWVTWTDMKPVGQVLFCKISAAIRSSHAVVADISTLNFNVMFEIGYAIGLGIPVMTVKDPSVVKDSRTWQEIGLLDTLAYASYSNSEDLEAAMRGILDVTPLASLPQPPDRRQPVYYLKAPIPVEGSLSLQSAMKKARIRYRSFDPLETPRLSLMEAQRQVAMSSGVVADLLDPGRNTAAHNARAAFVTGMAMAQGKAVLMVQEEFDRIDQPLDYRDLVKPYKSPHAVPGLARPFFEEVVERLQTQDSQVGVDRASPLAKLDLGDVAAENEILGLKSYFLSTGPSVQARQGHARLIIGRKGSGKTAIFYHVRDGAKRGHDRLIIDLKPEGHQFAQLKEAVLDRVSLGLQEHTLVALWQYLLTSEVARYALDRDRTSSRLNPLSSERYEALSRAYGPHDPGQELDFSQRLTLQIDRIARQLGAVPPGDLGGELTRAMYMGSNRDLADAVRLYLREKDSVWLLIDNLDKGWPIRSASDLDILVVRSLLEASRKIQREFSREEVEFHCLVFLRSDIYELLREGTPDKGKETPVVLDWNDRKAFEQLMLLRLDPRNEYGGDFERAWSAICVGLVEGQASFDYIVDRTLMRPRDLLRFVRACIDVALNRGHKRIEAEDVIQAETTYSLDLTTDFSYEITDTHPTYDGLLWVFDGSPGSMTWDEAVDRVSKMLGMAAPEAESAIDLLLWLGFLGVITPGAEPRFSYQVGGDAKRLTFGLKSGEGMVTIHPAFRISLGSGDR